MYTGAFFFKDTWMSPTGGVYFWNEPIAFLKTLQLWVVIMFYFLKIIFMCFSEKYRSFMRVFLLWLGQTATFPSCMR
jgi:hypothetical protein